MPIITPTSANIRISPNEPSSTGIAAAALDRFELVYQASAGILKAVNTSLAAAKILGMTYVTAGIGDRVVFVTNRGQVRSTTALWQPTEFYFLSSEAGKMCTWDELDEGNVITCVGYSLTDRIFQLNVIPTGMAKSAPPANTVAPVVSGIAQVGESLSCTTGTWTGTPAPTFAYQWQRNSVNIAGQVSQTYDLDSLDEATNIRCVVTATNSSGTASANSNAVGPIDP